MDGIRAARRGFDVYPYTVTTKVPADICNLYRYMIKIDARNSGSAFGFTYYDDPHDARRSFTDGQDGGIHGLLIMNVIDIDEVSVYSASVSPRHGSRASGHESGRGGR